MTYNKDMIGFAPMSHSEKIGFDNMMSELHSQMKEIRLENARLSRDAEIASSTAYLN